MAGEPILIIDDTPVNLKLTRILLANEGYQVRTAADAEEALSILENFKPDLMLVDIQLPGIDGLEFTRRVRADPRWRDIAIVALTAFAMKGDEQKALAAGCDGYITKPIDTRTLPGRLREYLEARKAASASADQPAPAPKRAATTGPLELKGPEVDALRRRFIAEGTTQCRQLLDALDGGFDADAAARLIHQWIGAAGLLGYNDISAIARELDQSLRERPLDNAQLRDGITRLIYAYCDAPEAQPVAIPDSIADALNGRRFALIGFADLDADRMCQALARVNALPRLFPASEPVSSEQVRNCEALIIHVRAETMSTGWLSPRTGDLPDKPLLLLGDRDNLLALDRSVQSRASEFLMDAWQPEEALMRASLALSRKAAPTAVPVPGAGGREYPSVRKSRPYVVLADDDPTVLSLVRATLENYGMEVRGALNGAEALQVIESRMPDAAILDVNMPGMDGFELLATIRSRSFPIRVILLTARQQEGDLVRGFTLGADDYVVKPFSPMELVARLKRLLWR